MFDLADAVDLADLTGEQGLHQVADLGQRHAVGRGSLSIRIGLSAGLTLRQVGRFGMSAGSRRRRC